MQALFDFLIPRDPLRLLASLAAKKIDRPCDESYYDSPLGQSIVLLRFDE